MYIFRLLLALLHLGGAAKGFTRTELFVPNPTVDEIVGSMSATKKIGLIPSIVGWSFFVIVGIIGFFYTPQDSLQYPEFNTIFYRHQGTWILLIFAFLTIVGFSLAPLLLVSSQSDMFAYLKEVFSCAKNKRATVLKHLFLDKKIDSARYILYYYAYVVCDPKKDAPTFYDGRDRKAFEDTVEWNRHRKQSNGGNVWLGDIQLYITKENDIECCHDKDYIDYIHGLRDINCDGKRMKAYELVSSSSKRQLLLILMIHIVALTVIIVTNIYCNWMYKGLLSLWLEDYK